MCSSWARLDRRRRGKTWPSCSSRWPTDVMETLFWVSALAVAYVYVGYPALLAVWARVAGRPVRRRPSSDSRTWPVVSVIVAARNEGGRLPGRSPTCWISATQGRSRSSWCRTARPTRPRRRSRRFERTRPLHRGAPRAESRWRSTPALPPRAAASSSLPTRVSSFRPTRSSTWSRTSTIRRLAAPPASSSSTASTTIRPIPPSATASALYWTYEKWLRRHESRSARRSARPAPSTRCAGSSGSRCPPQTLLDDVLAPMRAVLSG